MKSVRQTNAMMLADLDAVRSHVEPYDVDAGAARLAATLAATTVAATLGAGTLGAGAPSLLSAGAAALKVSPWTPIALALFIGAGATATVAVVGRTEGEAQPAAQIAAPPSVEPTLDAPADRAETASPLPSAQPAPVAELPAPASLPKGSAIPRGTASGIAPTTHAPTTQGRSIREEVRELTAFKQMLSSDPGRMLQGVDARPSHTGDLMDQERAILAIEALVSLGRLDEARARARAFLTAYPESAYAPRARQWVTLRGPAPMTP